MGANIACAQLPLTFDQLDPVFNQDLSFYIFQLPVWELVEFWLSGLLLFLLMAVALEYLLAGNTFSQGHFAGFSLPQQRHLYALSASLLIAHCFRALAQPLRTAVLAAGGHLRR